MCCKIVLKKEKLNDYAIGRICGFIDAFTNTWGDGIKTSHLIACEVNDKYGELYVMQRECSQKVWNLILKQIDSEYPGVIVTDY